MLRSAGGCADGCPGHAIHLSRTKNNALLGSRLFCHCWCGRPWVCIVPYLCQGARIWLCLGANYFVVLHRFMRGCACGCPGAGILLCLGSNYFVIVGVGVLGCALCHTSVREQKFGSAWEQIILSSLMWACVGVHVGVLGMLYICPGAGILLCLGAKYFVIVGVGVLGCEKIILSLLVWAWVCIAPYLCPMSGNKNLALLGSKSFCHPS